MLQVRPDRAFPGQVHLPPFCVICKQEGHASAYCPSRGKQPHLQIMGSAIPGEGFFCMEFEDDLLAVGEATKVANGAILSVEPGRLSLRTLKQELKHMVARDWDWQIVQVGDNDFAVVFPSADLLHMAKTSGKLFLSIHDITVLVRDSIHETIVPLSMPEVWLRLHGIPKKHRRFDRLMEGLKMLGRPIVVDELSLIRVGPVRMKFGCRAPDKMNGFVQVWFNHEGYYIRVEVEKLPMRPGDGPAASGPNNTPHTRATRVVARLVQGPVGLLARRGKNMGSRVVNPLVARAALWMLIWPARMQSLRTVCQTHLLTQRLGTSWAFKNWRLTKGRSPRCLGLW